MQAHFANFWCLKIQDLVITDRFVQKKKKHISFLYSGILFISPAKPNSVIGLVILY